MALKIRLARGGAKKRPYYRIVVADSRSPRDGRYIEHIGHYNPLLPKDNENRVEFNEERAKYWLGTGALPTERVARFLKDKGLFEWKAGNNPKKALPGKKALERVEEKKAKEEEAKAAVEVAEAEESATEEAAAEETSTDDAPTEENAAE